jgi:cell wall assembly regulator SMI1
MYKESAMPDYPPVTESFAKFQAWMLENAPDVNFHPPANPAAIENFSAKSSLNLPEDLRQILLISDGETRKSAGAIGNWRLMPIAEIQAAWGWITRVTAIGAFSELKTQTSPYLNDAWWHPGWVPFVSNDAGDYFCIDTQPPDHDRYGQILLFFQDRPERPLVAASLGAWLDRVIRDLSDGVYTYDEITGFDGEAFLWSALEGKHLLDNPEGRFITEDGDQ